MDAQSYIRYLNLLPHPEGGYYKETYRSHSEQNFENFSGKRNCSTGIYFLIEKNNFSAFHKIKSDEMWHFYGGDALEVIEITVSGELKITEIGNDIKNGQYLQYVVPAGNWFGSRVKKGGEFSLVGCTVSPGFDFTDFEMANRKDLTEKFQIYSQIIGELTR